mgnify:CR=1 FL=1|tara:strand:+ start:877 stop:1215 length:339 start_codon:yes stop_codon:yes gene_type:complete
MNNADMPAMPVVDHKGIFIQKGGLAAIGLTKREHFAARAPLEPQDWFEPSLTERPVLPPEGTYGNKERNEHKAEMCDWLAEADKQHLIQWPAAWADAMLAELERTQQNKGEV